MPMLDLALNATMRHEKSDSLHSMGPDSQT